MTNIPEDKLAELLSRLRKAAGDNLSSVILFGSAASDDFHPGISNLNILCLVRDSSFSALQPLVPVAKWWAGQKQPPFLVMTQREIERSTDVFIIELLDMQQHHRVLFGEDVLRDLQIPMQLHRLQVEYELREKLMLLRQNLILADNDSKLWDLLLGSSASVLTLFRHTVLALGDSAPYGNREAIAKLSERLGFEFAAVRQLMDLREKQIERRNVNVKDLFARYVTELEKVVTSVDEILDSRPSPNV